MRRKTEKIKIDRGEIAGKIYNISYSKARMKTEKIKIDGKNYKLMYVDSLKCNGCNIRGIYNHKNKTIQINNSLSPGARKCVLAHEICHVKDKTIDSTVSELIVGEIRAYTYGIYKEPIGAIRVIFEQKIKDLFGLFKLIVNHIS